MKVLKYRTSLKMFKCWWGRKTSKREMDTGESRHILAGKALYKGHREQDPELECGD